MFSGTLKDVMTNIIALVTVIGTAVSVYLQTIPTGGSINWFQVLIGVAVAVVGWFTGKTDAGKAA